MRTPVFTLRTRVGLALVAVMACVHVHAQSVVNTLSAPAPATTAAATAKRAPIPLSEYDPVTPPAEDVPTVVSPNQDKIAAALALLPGETNDQYTKRMTVKYDAALKEMQRLEAENQARMKALVSASHP